MKEDFYEMILNKFEFDWTLEHFKNKLWSKKNFDFFILEKIIEEMKTDCNIKIKGLISWLENEEKNPEEKNIKNISIKEDYLEKYLEEDKEYSEQESKDLFYVRNYLKKSCLFKKLTTENISSLRKEHKKFTSVYDLDEVISNYIQCDSMLLFCLVCRKTFNSPYELKKDLECKSDYYHPSLYKNPQISNSFSNSFLSNNTIKTTKTICLHEGCKKKPNNNEFICCHKTKDNKGCTFGEKKHQLIIIENIKSLEI